MYVWTFNVLIIVLMSQTLYYIMVTSTTEDNVYGEAETNVEEDTTSPRL